jgi:predicted AAA+ superfamily ATPase
VKKDYLKRIIDKELDLLLGSSGAVFIKGPKWCGKTRTARERAASEINMQDPDKKEYFSTMLGTKPSELLEGDTPRLIDEWQDAPILWNAVKFEVDKREMPGQFILAGSAVPKEEEKKKLHSGTGRIAQTYMRPMTLFESLESAGSVSLESLFNREDIKGTSSLSLEGIAFAIARGGWPASIGQDPKQALRHAHNYVEAVINEDISRVDEIERDPYRARKLMQSLARNISSEAKLSTIRMDIAGDEGAGIMSENTLYSYVNALRRLYAIEDLPAWSPNIRSKDAIRASPKRHFVDPSIAAAVLKLSPTGLMTDFKTFGLFFESLCIRDLRAYAQANEGDVFHYRDNNGLEIDAIIELHDRRWGAIEIKMGENAADDAAKNLEKLRKKVDTEKMGEPSFMAVITASHHAYRRADGIYVIPIGCLKD